MSVSITILNFRVHPIHFRLGFYTRPRCGSLHGSPDPIAAKKGEKAREEKDMETERQGRMKGEVKGKSVAWTKENGGCSLIDSKYRGDA